MEKLVSSSKKLGMLYKSDSSVARTNETKMDKSSFYIFRPIGARVKMCVATVETVAFFSHPLSEEKLIAGNLPIHSLPLILHDSLNHISVCTRTSSCRSGDPRGISGIFVLVDFSHNWKFPRFFQYSACCMCIVNHTGQRQLQLYRDERWGGGGSLRVKRDSSVRWFLSLIHPI